MNPIKYKFLEDNDINISTLVQLGNINVNINLQKLAEKLEINEYIKYIQYTNLVEKGENNKKAKNKKHFYNQLTIHLKLDKLVNVKIFNNGRIQMTGIKNDNQGLNSIKILSDEFIKIHDLEIFDKPDIIYDNKIETVLINSSFDFKTSINRNLLNRLVVDKGYYSSFEPCIYPGVNIKYYYNPLVDNKGICNCDKPCNGKGKNGQCKRITIAVFHSGKAIITGARSIDNIITAYNFITDIVNNNKDNLKIKE